MYLVFFFFKQKTAYELRISDWSSDVCSSDLQRRPLQQEAGQHQHEGNVLRVAHARIHALTGKPTLSLCPIQHGPGGRQQPEPSADKHETRDVEWTEMRIGAPTEPHLQQMPRVMAEPVHLRIVGAEPADRKSTRLNSSN